MKEPNQINYNYIDNLPQPIRSQLFNLFDLDTLHKVTAVSKKWKKEAELLIPKLDEPHQKILSLLIKYAKNRGHLDNAPCDVARSKLIAKFRILIEKPEYTHPMDLIVQILAIKIMNLLIGSEPFEISNLFLKKLDALLNDYLKKVIRDLISQDKLVFRENLLRAKYEPKYLLENYGSLELFDPLTCLLTELNTEIDSPNIRKEKESFFQIPIASMIVYFKEACTELYEESLQKTIMDKVIAFLGPY